MSESQEKITKEIKITDGIYDKEIASKLERDATVSFLLFNIDNSKELGNPKNLEIYNEAMQLFFKDRNIVAAFAKIDTLFQDMKDEENRLEKEKEKNKIYNFFKKIFHSEDPIVTEEGYQLFLNNYGVLAYYNGQISGGSQYIKEVEKIELNKKNQNPELLLNSKILMLSGTDEEKKEALEYLLDYRAKNPKAIGINYIIGLCYENGIGTKQNIEIAKQYYNFQIQNIEYKTDNNTVNGKAANNLGVILYNEGKVEEAIETFKKGVEYGNKVAERNLELIIKQELINKTSPPKEDFGIKLDQIPLTIDFEKGL